MGCFSYQQSEKQLEESIRTHYLLTANYCHESEKVFLSLNVKIGYDYNFYISDYRNGLTVFL